MKTISVSELKKYIDTDTYQIIDVREPYEFEERNIGGINIPLDSVISSIDKINRDKEVIFCCQSGKRSAAIVMTLIRKFGYQNLNSLEGGVNAYCAN